MGFIFLRRPLSDLIDRMESLAWIGLKAPHRHDHHPSLPESQSPIQPIQLESALASEQRHRDHEAQIIERHAQTDAENQRTNSELMQTHAEDQKTIKRLTASNASKDDEITKLRAEVARLSKLVPKPRQPTKPGEVPDFTA